MTKFIKVAGCVATVRSRVPETHHGETHYIRVSEIKELCEVVGKQRLREEITLQEYGTTAEDDRILVRDGADNKYYKYLPTTEIAVAFGVGGTDRYVADVHIGFLAPESVESLKARIDALEFPPAEPAPCALPVVERDVWRPGDTYAFWDLVLHPDDVSRRFLCIAPSQSSQKTVLDHKATWLELPKAVST